ncbi:MAG: hypothetical protein KDA87_18925 [Planctomycetales bacterium]|nr:hypothetical protein [Planctomycetales bacterium]
MLSSPERRVLKAFRQFLVSPGQMVCFYGPKLKEYSGALKTLTEKDFVVKEQFKGAYSLTPAGFAAMKKCDK